MTYMPSQCFLARLAAGGFPDGTDPAAIEGAVVPVLGTSKATAAPIDAGTAPLPSAAGAAAPEPTGAPGALGPATPPAKTPAFRLVPFGPAELCHTVH